MSLDDFSKSVFEMVKHSRYELFTIDIIRNPFLRKKKKKKNAQQQKSERCVRYEIRIDILVTESRLIYYYENISNCEISRLSGAQV